ncbi:GlxA family transcriptional regulator [Massilia sp. TN1-12]|uniref:GlxA family transcriptional regulator n=1 Tax=Massilia paldalensis TaxID=3377675 RepID=UPI00384C81E1
MRDIAIVAFPGFQLVDLAALNVFELANRPPGGPHYRLHVLSRQGGPVASSAGISVDTVAFDTLASPPDTMIVFGGDDLDAQPRALLDFLAQTSSAARRTASICSGVFLLAAAGLVEGRSVTTHWNLAAELQRRHPGLRVEPDRIFINDGPYWTSAGMTAGLDLALALVEEDVGSAAAREIARHMVLYYRRSGGQSQFASPADIAPRSDRIQAALEYARDNLCRPLSLEELADAAQLSRRQFSRSFRAETGQTPARAVEQLRVQAARELIETTSHPIEVVARESGFLDPERMRRAFLRAFGHPPQAIKRQARAGRLPT